MDENILRLAEEIQQLTNMAIVSYTPLANSIINGKVKNKNEIEHILDGMLDFCSDDRMLEMYKKVLRSLIHKHPGIVNDYIEIYRQTWEPDEEDDEDKD